MCLGIGSLTVTFIVIELLSLRLLALMIKNILQTFFGMLAWLLLISSLFGNVGRSFKCSSVLSDVYWRSVCSIQSNNVLNQSYAMPYEDQFKLHFVPSNPVGCLIRFKVLSNVLALPSNPYKSNACRSFCYFWYLNELF